MIPRVAKRLLAAGMLVLIVACSDPDAEVPASRPQVRQSGIDSSGKTPMAGRDMQPVRGSIPVSAPDLTSAEVPPEVLKQENQHAATAGQPEAAAPVANSTSDAAQSEIEVVDEFEVVDENEVVYQNLRALEPLEEDEAWFALGDPDPRIRAQGAWNLEPEGKSLDYLLHLVVDDPDPVVRMAALASLEEGDSYAAIKGVVDALKDPDSDVVLAAIDSLEFAGDETNVRDLEPLLSHHDVRVVAATEEAIRYLLD